MLMPNRSLFFENRSLFFESRTLFLLKIGVCFLKIGVCFYRKSEFVFWKSEFVFWKSEYWTQILSCHSALEFEQNQWRIKGRGRGTCPPPPFIFGPNWGPKGRKKTFWRPPPSLSQGLDDPPPPLPLIWRSLFQFSLTYGNKRPGRFI